MKSMNSGTPASVALPDRSSFGMIKSTSSRTVAYSWAVKNFGLKAARLPCAVVRAARACWCASSASASVQTKPAATGAAEISLSSVRRSMSFIISVRDGCRVQPDASSNLPRVPLLRDVLGRPHRQRENRPRAVLVRLGHEGAAVGHEQVLDVVRLAMAVQDRAGRIVPHPRHAELVNDPPARFDA